MRKEVIVAIVLGVVIGLIFAFGIFRINGVMKLKSSETIENNNTDIKLSASDINDTNSPLTLLKPNNMQVFGEDVIQITGAAKTESYIVVTGGTGDFVTKSDNNGSFNFEYEIDPSLNYLDINSISSNNNRLNSKVEVIYSSEAVKKEEVENDELEDKIEERLDSIQNAALFYKGTITDITDMSMQMKTSSGEIQQISYSANSTTFVKVGKTTVKITATDLAIGDFILAMGYKKDNGVLDTTRIIVTQPTTTENVKIFYGTVSIKNKTAMEISEQNSGNINIGIDNNSKTFSGDPANPTKIRFANVKQGDTVIGTYLSDKDENIARRIYILKTLEITPTPKTR